MDIKYSIGPITGKSKVIDLGASYAFGFTLQSRATTRKICALSAIALGQHDGWMAQLLDEPIVAVPARGNASVVVQVSATTKGDQIDPPRCEVVLSVVELSGTTVVNTQARLMLMALKAPPTPEPRIQVVLKDSGGINNRFGAGVQVAQVPIGFDIFVRDPGSYAVTPQLREPTGWTIGPLVGSPFQVNPGNTAAQFVTVLLTAGQAARETDLFLTVTGPGVSAKFTMPVIP